MFRRSFVARLLAVILLFSVLAVGAYLTFRAGEARGYAVGMTNAQQLQAPQDGQTNPPAAPYAYPGYYYGYRPHFPFFFPFGFLFFPFALLFLFFVVGGLFRFLFWGTFWRGPWGYYPHHHGPGDPHGPAAEQPAKPAE